MKNIYRLLVVFTFLPITICAQVDTINSDKPSALWITNQADPNIVTCSYECRVTTITREPPRSLREALKMRCALCGSLWTL